MPFVPSVLLGGKLRVLLVDDDVEVLKQVELRLARDQLEAREGLAVAREPEGLARLVAEGRLGGAPRRA